MVGAGVGETPPWFTLLLVPLFGPGDIFNPTEFTVPATANVTSWPALRGGSWADPGDTPAGRVGTAHPRGVQGAAAGDAHRGRVSLGASFPTSSSAMDELVAIGIATELTGKKRNRVFAQARYLATLGAGTSLPLTHPSVLLSAVNVLAEIGTPTAKPLRPAPHFGA